MINPDDEPDALLGSVSVVANDSSTFSCAQADAYATAFFVLGEKEGVPLADELGLAVLFLSRSDDAATRITESMSDSFKSAINSVRADESDSESSPQDESKSAKKERDKD